ncbi:hypothetical protein EUGRSUZ_J02911 [Eucalyptus grandis]|uniref:Uncharacterized protein n=2 Tax=Eucalyptus grandis TaxID=71139 RepID=A0ACC3J9X1_EUCGR|nr:hypothetical protein EUGRSUZ_J02911 [Eucalyptus grandis]
MQYARKSPWICLLLIIHNTSRAPNEIKTRMAATDAMIGAIDMPFFFGCTLRPKEIEGVSGERKPSEKLSVLRRRVRPGADRRSPSPFPNQPTEGGASSPTVL